MHPHGFMLSTGRVGESVIMQCNIRSCFTGVQHLGVNSRMKRLRFYQREQAHRVGMVDYIRNEEEQESQHFCANPRSST